MSLRKSYLVIFHMLMQQRACFSTYSGHTEPEVPTLVHAHALPPPLIRHCTINPWDKKTKHKLLCRMQTWALGEQGKWGHVTLSRYKVRTQTRQNKAACTHFIPCPYTLSLQQNLLCWIQNRIIVIHTTLSQTLHGPVSMTTISAPPTLESNQ